MNIILKSIFGSHLYGTDTEQSDTDYKGIFLPEKNDILLGKIPKHFNSSTGGAGKNSNEDVDIEIFSLHEFIKLACEGQTIAFDMLHTPPDMLINTSAIWDKIVKNKERFYTKNLKAFVGYALRQAAKYSIKGSRLAEAKNLLNIMHKYNLEKKMSVIWEELPVSDYGYYIKDSPNGIRQYMINNKILQETQYIGYAMSIVETYLHKYGQRARDAKENKNIDWKAYSHAIRAALQIKELLTTNNIRFPLKDADYLLQIKLGKLDHNTEVMPVLENLMDEIKILSEKSKLPKKVNRKYWDKFIIDIIEEYVL